MANKTLYIPAEDEELWEAVERVAEIKKTSFYKVVRASIDKGLPIIAAEPAPAERWAAIAAEPDTQTA